jgi:hypothetical protein
MEALQPHGRGRKSLRARVRARGGPISRRRARAHALSARRYRIAIKAPASRGGGGGAAAAHTPARTRVRPCIAEGRWSATGGHRLDGPVVGVQLRREQQAPPPAGGLTNPAGDPHGRSSRAILTGDPHGIRDRRPDRRAPKGRVMRRRSRRHSRRVRVCECVKKSPRAWGFGACMGLRSVRSRNPVETRSGKGRSSPGYGPCTGLLHGARARERSPSGRHRDIIAAGSRRREV